MVGDGVCREFLYVYAATTRDYCIKCCGIVESVQVLVLVYASKGLNQILAGSILIIDPTGLAEEFEDKPNRNFAVNAVDVVQGVETHEYNIFISLLGDTQGVFAADAADRRCDYVACNNSCGETVAEA